MAIEIPINITVEIKKPRQSSINTTDEFNYPRLWNELTASLKNELRHGDKRKPYNRVLVHMQQKMKELENKFRNPDYDPTEIPF